MLGLDDLRAFRRAPVVMQGQEQDGPALLTVLAEAGVDSFRSVRVVGMGVRDDGLIVLEPNEVDDNVLLDIAERGHHEALRSEDRVGRPGARRQRIEVR